MAYSDHFGIKFNINSRIACLILFTSNPNHLSEKLTANSLFKAANRPIFLDNRTLSKFYDITYNINDFPQYVQNYAKENSKEALAREIYKGAKESYLKTFYGKNSITELYNLTEGDIFSQANAPLLNNFINNNSDQLDKNFLYFLESNFSAHYVEFTYKNVLISTSLGILPLPLSQMFLHVCNNGSKIILASPKNPDGTSNTTNDSQPSTKELYITRVYKRSQSVVVKKTSSTLILNEKERLLAEEDKDPLVLTQNIIDFKNIFKTDGAGIIQEWLSKW